MVQLDPDHPGFRDKVYRARRDHIAQLALEHVPGTPPPDVSYTEQEHKLWRLIRSKLKPCHKQYACTEFLENAERLNLPRTRIPQLREVSALVEGISGFRLEPVAGLVKPRVFLETLANGVFLSTQYIRHPSSPLYTPEPDIVHELIGHAMMLASRRIAELSRLVGEAVRRTTTDESLEQLARVYWFTIEFGAIREAASIKAYGAGLLSSAGEMKAMHRAEIRPFDLEAASHQTYDPTNFQPFFYCADSFDQMFHTLREFLWRWR
jgi:phenylalanine-4-hydroxylase